MRQAYLIMAHNEFELLKELLQALDYEKNDIYLHIDKKAKEVDYEDIKKSIKKSNLYFMERMDVKWGSVKQIECTMNLLNLATQKKHSYYHFISGVDFPLKSTNQIYDFFDNSNKDFVSFDDINNITDFYLDRVKYYHMFENNWRNKNKTIARICCSIRARTVKLERSIGINRVKKTKLEFRKGANWFSITEPTAKYIIENKALIKYFKHSYCADELFIQTIIYNSRFKNNIYLDKQGNPSNLRYVDWNKGNPAILKIEDYDAMTKSKMLFARKFSLKVDSKIIKKLSKSNGK